MAVAYDNSTASGANTSSLSFSHTCTGSDLVLVFMIKVYSTSDLVTAATYNSVGATLVSKRQNGNNRWSYMYILANPATGSNTVNVTLSSTQLVGCSVHSYTGAETTGIPDSQNSTTVATTNVDIATTTVADNSWLVGMYAGQRTYTPGSGTTQRQYQGTADQLYTFDSNGAKTPAGSYSLLGTQSQALTCCLHICSIAPAGSAPVASANNANFFGGGL